MKSLATLLLFSLLLVSACKKEKKTINGPKTPAVAGVALHEFAMIPVKDASWKIHIQGILNSQMKVDTAFHAYVTVTAANQDTVVNGLVYYKYKVDWTPEYKNDPNAYKPRKFSVFIREDTVVKTLYTTATAFQETPLVIFNDEEVGKIVNTKPELEIKYIDSVVVEGQYLKRWQACNTYDRNLEYLYKAYGVATRTGPVLRNLIIYEGGQVMSTEFTYKSSTLKFIHNVVF